MGNRWSKISTEDDKLGAQLGSLQSVVNALKNTAVKIVGAPISIPEVDGTFPVTFRRDSKRKGGVYVTLAFLIPSETRLLIVKAIRTADRTDAATFRANKFSYSIDDIDDTERAAQRVVRELWAKDPLEYNTQYDVFRLAAFADSESTDGTVIGENPQVDVLFNDVALYQFTTPQVFNLPSDPNASLITTSLDATTRAFDATTTFRVNAPLTDASGNQSWRSSGANEVVVVLTDPDGKTIKVPHYLNDTELDQVSGGRGFVDITHKPEFPGGLYTWVRNIAWVTSQKRESSGASVQYRAANLVLDPTGLTGKALNIVTNVDPYTPKSARVDLVFNNPISPNTVSLKNVTVERKIFGAADSTYQVIIKKFSLKDDEYSSPGAKTIVIGEGVVFKPSLTYELRCTIFAIGGSSVQFTTGAVSTGSNPDVAVDTAIPTLSTNPDTGTTGATVAERHSKIDVFCPLPSANINTLDNYQVILSTSSTHPAGDPTEGSNGVLKIKYGQNPTFNLDYFADFGDQFYVLFRAHNAVGYSLWSAGTNQDGYSRPIQDFIGTAVPTLAEGLIRAGSGVGVSSTVFQLDGSASAEDDFYNGMALNLTTPGTSSPTQDTWRTITDYVGSTKQATVNTAYSSTPGVSAFIVNNISVTGDRASKSGTGHTTTTFVLESAASSSDDFYLGYSLYIPSMATASDRIRKIVDYVGSTRTLTVDIAFGTAPSGALAYLLINGSIGFGSPSLAESLTEPAYPVPFRWYLNDQDVTVFEVLPPTGENAFSLTHFQITSRRRNAGAALRDDSGAVAIGSGTAYSSPAAPSGVFWAAAIRFRNMYRTSGSDGWSALSAYVALLNVDGSPNYDPDKTGGTVLVDWLGEESYPRDRYGDYT